MNRYRSIDIIRGAVMVLMAIDHVRVYAGLPAGGPTPGIFFTRWITHFCAPAFVFLAGTSAFFYGRRHPDLTRFLLTRGVWLILLELTVLRIGWTFNVDFAHYNMAGVIWMLGWSMIILAALAKLPVKAVGIIGVAVILLHNLLPMSDGSGALWKILYVGFFQGPIMLGENNPGLIVLYSIIPWFAVMAAGYAFGALIEDAQTRGRADAQLLRIGLGAIGLFFILRTFDLYGDPQPWRSQGHLPPLLAFLNTSKYPASLLFLLMTLGPTIAVMPLLDSARLRAGRVLRALEVFGRVPFFYYVLHIPLIHLLALAVSQIRLGTISPWLFENHPMGAGEPPDGYPWSLPLLYLVWSFAIVLLFLACKWFADIKARRSDSWLRYL